jgi:putative redox protein
MKSTHRSVSATLDGAPYVTRLESRGISAIADEPPEHGGQDLGLRPHEWLLGALASCTAITMRMYAERKHWDVGPIHVEAAMDRDQEGSRVDTRIRMEVTLRPDLPAEQRARLLQIAAMCPVHRTLENPISMSISEAGPV